MASYLCSICKTTSDLPGECCGQPMQPYDDEYVESYEPAWGDDLLESTELWQKEKENSLEFGGFWQEYEEWN